MWWPDDRAAIDRGLESAGTRSLTLHPVRRACSPFRVINVLRDRVLTY